MKSSKPRKPLPRSARLERGKKRLASGKLSRGKGIRRKPRSGDDFARTHHSVERVEWVNAHPCGWCGVVGFTANAHVCGNGGMSRKGHYSTIAPLCNPRLGIAGCHADYDQRRPPFDAEPVREQVQALAAATETAWRLVQGEAA